MNKSGRKNITIFVPFRGRMAAAQRNKNSDFLLISKTYKSVANL